MASLDVEEQKQTLLSTEDVEMWVTHLDSVKKRWQAGARKTAGTRKQKSSDKVATAGNEFWPCLCGGPESGNMTAFDNPGSILNALDLWMHQVESGFALNALFNICSKLSRVSRKLRPRNFRPQTSDLETSDPLKNDWNCKCSSTWMNIYLW